MKTREPLLRKMWETTSSCAKESSQRTKSTCSKQGQKFDVFLSHSGKQKFFIRQLYEDLTSQGVSCFFDQDRECLPVGEDFPPRIFEAIKTCKVAVLLLSTDFLESKWPMLELSAFVEARDKSRTNPELKILPVFFMISPDALKNMTADNEKWKQLNVARKKRDKWHRALQTIRRINGLTFGGAGGEVLFKEEIVKEILHMLPTARYHVPCMQGEIRMCQKLANFFNKVKPNEKGIRIAGLYERAGHGKTTLGKAFCNFNLEEFEGKVCHLEFSRGDPLQNVKLALQHLTHRTQSYVHTLTSQDQAKVELSRRVEGLRVLLVLDNVTKESIEEVAYYLKEKWGGDSWILLSARSVDVLVKYFQVDKQSCMRVPMLEQKEAVAILMERTFAGEPKLEVEDRRRALYCAKRCLFKETSTENGPRAARFHPLALKAFGGYLMSKHGFMLSKWVDEVDGMADRSSDGFEEVFAVLCQAFDDMCSEYRTIFMHLTVYGLPNMSFYKVTEWMAIICNQDISFVEKAVQDLRQKAFIEEIAPEIRIHDLYTDFAQSKAKEMGKWLWWKGDGSTTRGPISNCNEGFESAKLEQCMYHRIAPKYLENLFVFQLVDVQNMSKLDLGSTDRLRSLTIRNCKLLAALDGMEKLADLAWLQIRGVDPMFKLPELNSLQGLQYLEIDIAGSQALIQLGDLTKCSRLREIYVVCPYLMEFPRLKGMKHLEKVEFGLCDKLKGPLDCTDCVKLQTIVLDSCSQMVASPLLAGCKKLSKIVLKKCDAVTACPDINVPEALKTLELFTLSKPASAPKNLESCNGLENLQLWNMVELKELPSFRRLSNLTVLVLYECGLREPPDLTSCVILKDVYFFKLKSLIRFPNFSSLKELKKLRLYECTRVQDSPDISGCHKLQVFHLVHNDNMEGLPQMGGCSLLKEIEISWHSKEKVTNEATDPNCLEVDSYDESLLGHFKYEDLQKLSGVRLTGALKKLQWLGCFKDEESQKLSGVRLPGALKKLQWLKGRTILVKHYFRGGKFYYSIAYTYPYLKKIVVRVVLDCEKSKRRLLKKVAMIKGLYSVDIGRTDNENLAKLIVIGYSDPVAILACLRRYHAHAELIQVQALEVAHLQELLNH